MSQNYYLDKVIKQRLEEAVKKLSKKDFAIFNSWARNYDEYENDLFDDEEFNKDKYNAVELQNLYLASRELEQLEIIS